MLTKPTPEALERIGSLGVKDCPHRFLASRCRPPAIDCDICLALEIDAALAEERQRVVRIAEKLEAAEREVNAIHALCNGLELPGRDMPVSARVVMLIAERNEREELRPDAERYRAFKHLVRDGGGVKVFVGIDTQWYIVRTGWQQWPIASGSTLDEAVDDARKKKKEK
jgi:hypothetical protein